MLYPPSIQTASVNLQIPHPPTKPSFSSKLPSSQISIDTVRHLLVMLSDFSWMANIYIDNYVMDAVSFAFLKLMKRWCVSIWYSAVRSFFVEFCFKQFQRDVLLSLFLLVGSLLLLLLEKLFGRKFFRCLIRAT